MNMAGINCILWDSEISFDVKSFLNSIPVSLALTITNERRDKIRI